MTGNTGLCQQRLHPLSALASPDCSRRPRPRIRQWHRHLRKRHTGGPGDLNGAGHERPRFNVQIRTEFQLASPGTFRGPDAAPAENRTVAGTRPERTDDGSATRHGVDNAEPLEAMRPRAESLPLTKLISNHPRLYSLHEVVSFMTATELALCAKSAQAMTEHREALGSRTGIQLEQQAIVARTIQKDWGRMPHWRTNAGSARKDSERSCRRRRCTPVRRDASSRLPKPPP